MILGVHVGPRGAVFLLVAYQVEWHQDMLHIGRRRRRRWLMSGHMEVLEVGYHQNI